MFEYITVNKDRLIGRIEFKNEIPIYETKKVYLPEDGMERSLELKRLGKKSSDVYYESPYDWRKPYIMLQYKSGVDEDALNKQIEAIKQEIITAEMMNIILENKSDFTNFLRNNTRRLNKLQEKNEKNLKHSIIMEQVNKLSDDEIIELFSTASFHLEQIVEAEDDNFLTATQNKILNVNKYLQGI